MKEYGRLSHEKWECKYHIVWVPKYWQKKLYGEVKRRFGEIIREMSKQKGMEVIEGHAIPPKYSISYAVGYLKVKSAKGWSETGVQESDMIFIHME